MKFLQAFLAAALAVQINAMAIGGQNMVVKKGSDGLQNIVSACYVFSHAKWNLYFVKPSISWSKFFWFGIENLMRFVLAFSSLLVHFSLTTVLGYL
jgi:hypothetical protein